MAKEYAKLFYKSKEWQKCRNGYIKERALVDGGMCEVCHENPGYILHHKTMLTSDNIGNPDVTLNWDNLRWECKDCHDREEGHGINNKGAGLFVRFDAKGQPMSIRDVDSPPSRKDLEQLARDR